jgi:hypothetical protein
VSQRSPGGLSSTSSGQRAVDDVVDGAVAVERGDEVLAALDRVHRLLPAREHGDDVRRRQRGEHPAHPAVGVQRPARLRQVPVADVGAQRVEHGADLREGERAVAYAEQRERHQRGRRHRRAPVDADGDLERGLLQGQAALLARLERRPQRDRLGEPHLRRPDLGQLRLRVAGEPGQPLPLLHRAACSAAIAATSRSWS